VKSFLLSSLVHRFGTASLDDFVRAHPHDWLLWEPGGWSAPAPVTVKLMPISEGTPLPQTSGEALALAMQVTPSTTQLTLGRGPNVDAMIAEGTLSQVHLLFMISPGGWTVRDANSRNGTWLDRQKLQPGQPAGLKNGSRIKAGQVALTWYTPQGLLNRIKG
jgi:hypothetical protein